MSRLNMTSQGTQPMEALRPQMSGTEAEVDVESIDRVLARAAPILRYRSAAPTFYQRRGKRLLDITLGALLLVAFLPIIAALALAVYVTSGWPVLYGSERVGKNGRLFRVWKFRTMVRDADEVLDGWKAAHPELAAEYGKDFKLREDPRVTALGRVLRKSSLDELPQLWNVIRGEMSLVGPRPVVVEELSRYGDHAEMFLSVPPGITGRWQLNGRNDLSYPDRIWVELAYCRSVTCLGDLMILARTLLVPFRYGGI